MNQRQVAVNNYFCVFVVLLVFLMPISVLSGNLDDFERDATRTDRNDRRTNRSSSKTDSGSSHSGSASPGVIDDMVGEIASDVFAPLFAGFFGGIAQGGRNSLERVETPGLLSTARGIIPRKSGEALIPFISFEVAYQDVESDVTAWDYRLEVGYGPLGFQARRTLYDERSPVASLEALQYHALYRMSFGSDLEVDIGAGALILEGNEENSGFSVTVPVLYHPSEVYGFEFRPVWSTINENDIQDFDFSVLFGSQYASIRFGYRWFRSPNQSLDGPVVGVALRW